MLKKKGNLFLSTLFVSLLSKICFAGYYNLNAFFQAPGTPTTLVFLQNPSSSVISGAFLSSQPLVAVTDSRGRLATGATDGITLAAYTDSSCTHLAPGILTSSTANPLISTGGRATFLGVKYSSGGTIYLGASASGRTSVCSTGIVLSALGGNPSPWTAPTAKMIQISGDSEFFNLECHRYVIGLKDNWERSATQSVNTIVNLLGNGSGAYYLDAACSSSIVTAQIPANKSETVVYFKNTVAETNILSVQDQGGTLNSNIFQVIVYAKRLVFTPSFGLQSMLTTQACGAATAYKVEFQKSNGTSANKNESVMLSIGFSNGGSGTFYTDILCTIPVPEISTINVTNTAGSNIYTFYYKPPAVPTQFKLTTAAPIGMSYGTTGVFIVDTKEVSVNLAAPTKLVINGSSGIPVSGCKAYNVSSKAADDSLSGQAVVKVITFANMGNAKIYSDAACSLEITSLNLLAGKSTSDTFYIRSINAGSINLSATATGLTAGELNIAFLVNGAVPVEISSGGTQGCALLSDSSIKCWGANGSGALGDGTFINSSKAVLVAGVTNAAHISSGNNFTCALLLDSTIRCWGINDNGQLGNNSLTNATQISAGGQHACALLADSTVKCWGANTMGQLGNGSTLQSTSPVSVIGISTATQISSGLQHSCARLSNSTLKCWGANAQGQLGDGSTSASGISTAVLVTGISNALQVSVGTNHTCALLSDSTIKCWGLNTWGQLGTGTTTNSPTAVSVLGVANATQVSSGANHTCARLLDSTSKCWGSNNFGGLGVGSNIDSLTAVAVTGLVDVMQVSSGTDYTCSLHSDSSTKCWGLNTNGQLGNGTATSTTLNLLEVQNVKLVTPQVALGHMHTCALLSDSTVRCWGNNSEGALGNNSGVAILNLIAVDVVGISNAIQIASGLSYNCVLLSDSTIKCWGDGAHGKLGVGSLTSVLIPLTTVSGISAATQISAGGEHSCALLADSSIKCWGLNGLGQIGNGTVVDSLIPVAVTGITSAIQVSAGFSHTCARLSDSTIKCWGSNSSGELGNGLLNDSTIPVQVSGVSNAVSVTSGNGFSCALLSDSTIKCWGKNSKGNLGNGTLINSSIAINVSGIYGALQVSAGSNHVCALLSNSKISCWGENLYAQLGNGTGVNTSLPVFTSGISTAIKVTAGDQHTCAVMSDYSLYCWGNNINYQLGNYGNNFSNGNIYGGLASEPINVLLTP